MTFFQFWHDLERRFRELKATHGDGLSAQWIETAVVEHGGPWYLFGEGCDREKKQFELLATRGATKLGHLGTSGAVTFWLDCLRTKAPNFWQESNLTSGGAKSKAGTLFRVVEASADYSLDLATVEIDVGTLVARKSPLSVAGNSDEPNANREERLQAFVRVHVGTTFTDIWFSAKVQKIDFKRWRKGLHKDTSVMSERIEEVLRGERALCKKPRKRSIE